MPKKANKGKSKGKVDFFFNILDNFVVQGHSLLWTFLRTVFALNSFVNFEGTKQGIFKTIFFFATFAFYFVAYFSFFLFSITVF